jgi:hypothetical protein
LAKSGKELEDFVKNVESVFLPLGFNISSREKIFDEDGTQIAEFDLIISGKLGTTEINWLIECRDRPSEGAAPSSWIQQLIGRQEVYEFNKVTAVSSTGFSKSAVIAAKKAGIELRTLKDLKPDSMFNWFKSEHLTFRKTETKLKNVKFHIPKLPVELNNKLKEFHKPEQKILTHTSEDKLFSLLDMWRYTMNRIPGIDSDVEPNKNPIPKEFPVKYPDPKYRFLINLQEKEYQIEGAIFFVDIMVVKELIPISKTTQYHNEEKTEKPIAESVHFELNDGTKYLDIAIHKVSNEDQTMILVSRKEI